MFWIQYLLLSLRCNLSLRSNEQKLHQAMLWGFATLHRGRGWILNTVLKIPILFCNWLSEIYKKKRKMRSFACRSKKLKCALMNLIMLWYTLSWSYWQQTVQKKRKKCHNVFKLLLSGTCSKRVFTTTQWQILQFG